MKGFDTLRAYSIILVISSHLGLKALLPQGDFVQDRFWGLISGGTGVNIFFTLSGFLITSILLAELAKNSRISIKNFYVRRFLRLLPPLVIFYVATAIFMQQGVISSSGVGLAYSMFYVYNFVPNPYYTAELGHTWSLAIEEQFYIVWPFAILIFRSKRLLMLLTSIVILICVIVVWIIPELTILKNYNVGRWFIPAVGPILGGSLFALLNTYLRDKWKLLFQGNRKFILLIAILLTYPLYAPIFLFPAGIVINAIGVGLLLVRISLNQSSRIVSILEFKPLMYIGNISYGLYVYQGLFLRTGPGSDFWIQQFPINILFTFVTALISYHFLEKPILKLKSRFR
ncbi:MAG: acyltransferase [Crocinitomicaceae bacterium]|nr:acyltransferase [Crocinitomicaceae bacterium]